VTRRAVVKDPAAPTARTLAEGPCRGAGAELEADVARDRRADAVLTDLGWRVLRRREDEDPNEVVDATWAELAR
jgi:hypothetical protein